MDQSNWIKSPKDLGSASACFVRTFEATPDVTGGTLSVSAVGLFEARLNGEKLGRGVLTPGYTDYNRRTQYMTYDLTGLLGRRNTLEITAAPGWAVGHFGYSGSGERDHVYSDHYAINAELTTSVTWETCCGPYLMTK